jgi:enoyl-CoA hydratase/carnithine racemase
VNEQTLDEVRAWVAAARRGDALAERVRALVDNGADPAAWLIMSGERIPARQAEAWGLVDLVVDDLDAGIEQVCGALARQSPHALREIKRLLLATREERDYEAELEAFARCLRSEDGQEGVAAFLEKRDPTWVGR